MRLSRYFLPVLKETPSEAQIVSHRYMLRAGMIKQNAAGIYSWLPLGFKVLRKLENIVHEEQMRAGHVPMLMPTLQSAELWRESGRYDDYGEEMLRITDRQGRDMLYGPTNEEMITDIFRSHVGSYKDLPLTLYHIQWKFRDEMRPRFGVMRGREFFMKDGYTFDLTREDAMHAYNRHLVSYLRTYERMGLQAIPMRADSGPIGGDDTHEFLVLAETGESEGAGGAPAQVPVDSPSRPTAAVATDLCALVEALTRAGRDLPPRPDEAEPTIDVHAFADRSPQAEMDTLDLAALFARFDRDGGQADPALLEALDRERERLREQAAFAQTVIGGSAGLTTGLSIGYAIWLIRGGALAGSVLSSLPAWRFVDPLPVLGTLGTDAPGGDGESLQSLVDGGMTEAMPGPESGR